MRDALEQLHNGSHVYFGNVSPHIAFRDPLVFLLHSNVDRIFAQWQTDPAHPERLPEPPSMARRATSTCRCRIRRATRRSRTSRTSSSRGARGPDRRVSADPAVGADAREPGRPRTPTMTSLGRRTAVLRHEPERASGSTRSRTRSTRATNRYQVIFNDVPEDGDDLARGGDPRLHLRRHDVPRQARHRAGRAFGVAVGQARQPHGSASASASRTCGSGSNTRRRRRQRRTGRPR